MELELDKLLKLLEHNNGIIVSEINNNIARMLFTLTPDGKSREYLEAFKVKLNFFISSLKRSFKDQYEKKYKLVDKENRIKEWKSDTNVDYEKSIVTRVYPVMNPNGKYVVNLEKVVKDLLLIRNSLQSIFRGNNKLLEGSNCTILEELNNPQDIRPTIEDIAKQYRVLLNTILRFAVEATWIVRDKIGCGKSEEVLGLKLANAELREKLAEAEEEIKELQEQLELFAPTNRHY